MAILINDNTARVQYTATSGQTTFAVPFEFFENSDLKVYRNSTLQTITTHYTLTGAGVTGGGNLTFVSGVTLNDIITIVRDIPIKRVTDFPLSGPFNIAALNLQLDQLTAMMQEVNTLVTTRVPLLAEFDQPSTFSALPTLANRANRYFVFDGNGNPSATSTALSVVDFTATGAGSVLRNVQDKLNEYISAADFGAVGAPLGTTPPDETAALTAFFNSANANPGVEHRLAQRAYGISAALPTINQSGVKIYGSGQSTVHNVGQVFSGTTIFWLGGAVTAVMQTIQPTAGASNQHLSGITYYGVSFNCGSAVTQGVVIRSVRSSLIGIGVANATTTGVVLGVLATGSLGENESLQTNEIYLSLRQVDGAGANGVPLRLQGSSTANVSLNRFRMVEIIHGNTSAVIEENADNNIWEEFRSFATGSATYSVEWQGAAIEADSCRAELFDKFSANKPVLAHGTGTYTYPSTNNIINSLDADNATPLPVYGTSATGFWRDTRGIFGGSSGGILAEKAAVGDNITTALAARTRLGTSTVHIVNGSTDHAQFSDSANTNRWGVSIDGSGNFRFVRLAGTGSVNLPSQSSFNGGAITLGAADSGGTGFRVLRVPN